jgi:ABC-type nitrate/sulfonate/bicarbonate transport system ATPase subunit
VRPGAGSPAWGPPAPPLLRAARLSKAFAGRTVIAEATVSLRPGTVTLFTAPSGSGKSTLLEILAGVLAPDSGTVERALPASLMFQDDALVPWLDARGNLAYILPAGMPGPARRESVARWLRRFELPEGARPPSMSSGMKRRLSLARAFLAERALTLLDEPFAFLDERWRAEAAGLIRAKADSGGAVALAAHDADPCLRDACGGILRILELGPSPVTLRADDEAPEP